MKSTSTPRLTAGVHTHTGGGESRRKNPIFGEPVIFDRLFPRDRVGLWRGLCCLAAGLLLILGVVLALTVSGVLGGQKHPGDQPGVLPPLNTEGQTTGEETRSSHDTDPPADGTRAPADGEQSSGEPDSGDQGSADTSDPPETGTVTLPVETQAPEGTHPPTFDTTAPEPPPEDHPETTPDTPAEDGDGDETRLDTEPPVETQPAVPEGCFPIQAEDMSHTDRGVGSITGEGEDLPMILPDEILWGCEGSPTVLIINTHPYEGYGDGKGWYDPASGGLALTETVNDPDGIVALGAALGRTLRGQGVTVMHLRIAVSAEDTAAEIYAHTESVARSYCRLYPDIALVLDLRRSAELTEEGGILRTAGSLAGADCAQVRLSVSGGREEAAVGRDLAVALALREKLWRVEPTISRPVRIKSGSGILGDLPEVSVLTVEMGSAGNLFSEAERLVEPLAGALADLIRETGGATS